ncbi:hypothetical protein CHS0354_038280 [Potamilus streckersoni]|uniref:Uncharacterized protein n=1 Tax=Potamilus streckersoni TaxID=2493646 RepID=A0AAE0TCH7_9BIVA|nr:hypothetical protein CHS0354_038280 [Potamilus streckersoni]
MQKQLIRRQQLTCKDEEYTRPLNGWKTNSDKVNSQAEHPPGDSNWRILERAYYKEEPTSPITSLKLIQSTKSPDKITNLKLEQKPTRWLPHNISPSNTQQLYKTTTTAISRITSPQHS